MTQAEHVSMKMGVTCVACGTQVDAGSPAVRCFGPGRERCGEVCAAKAKGEQLVGIRMQVRYLALFTDQLLLNATPGPPEETISIAGRADWHVKRFEELCTHNRGS